MLRTALCPEAGTGENRVRLGNGTLNQRHSFAAPETQNAAEVDPPQFTPAWCQLGVQYGVARLLVVHITRELVGSLKSLVVEEG